MTFKDIYEAIGESIDNYGHHMMSAQAFYASVVDAHTALGELLGQDSKPKQISITINDDTIMDDIQYEIDCLIEDKEISFPSDEAREEFADDCLDEIVSKYESYPTYIPDWESILDTVQSMAQDNGYMM